MLQAAPAFVSTFESRARGAQAPVRGLAGTPPNLAARHNSPQCQESGLLNRAVRTTRGRRTRSWRHCAERAATCCQSCGANPAGHARRTRWASTSESGAATGPCVLFALWCLSVRPRGVPNLGVAAHGAQRFACSPPPAGGAYTEAEFVAYYGGRAEGDTAGAGSRTCHTWSPRHCSRTRRSRMAPALATRS